MSFPVDSGKRLLDEIGTNGMKLVDERLCLCGDVQLPRAPVIRIAGALDQTGFFETVDDPAQGDRLEVEHVRELDLPKARRAGQLEQHLPLRARDPQAGGKTIERLAQGVRGLADFEGERFHGSI